jgi:transposase
MDGRAEVIEELRALIAEQAAPLEQQAAQLKQQAARIAELELALAKAQQNSATSSKPPSSDLTNPPPKRQRPGRRKKPRGGAQAGHPRHVREPLPPERVDETLDYEIAEADVRRLNLMPPGAFEVIHHLELPQTPVYVTEHRLTGYRAPDGDLYIPDVSELPGPLFGPRLLATIGWLKSVGHLRYSALEAWREDVLQVPVSRGSLAKLCTGTRAAALATAYEELTEAIPRQAQLGSDETSLKDNGKRHWIWCITAATFSVFSIAATRSRAVLEKLIGPEFTGYVNVDYFSAPTARSRGPFGSRLNIVGRTGSATSGFCKPIPPRLRKRGRRSCWRARASSLPLGTVATRWRPRAFIARCLRIATGFSRWCDSRL